MKKILMFVPVLLLAACGPKEGSENPEPAVEAAPEKPDAEQVTLDKARSAAGQLGKELQGHLLEALETAGAAGAVRTCKEVAGPTAAKVAEETGVKVGRASLKLRNKANEGPEWVRAWLTASAELDPSVIQGFERVELDGERRFARVLRPLTIQPVCLKCHGTEETLDEGVAAAVSELYTEDEGLGYAVGTLRGALWAEVEVAE